MRQMLSLAVAGAILAWAPIAKAADEDVFRVYWKNGLNMETADESFKLKIGGRLQNDWAWWSGGGDIEDAVGDDVEDGTEFRRARIHIEGEIYERIIFKAEYDFADDAAFKDVYLGAKDLPLVGTVKIGHFKEPFSLEELTSSRYLTFLERGLPNVFVPSRNTGIGFSRTFVEERATLSAGVFRESDDFGSQTGDTYQFAARVTGVPLYDEDGRLVHVGFSYRHTNPEEDELAFSQRPEVHIAPSFVDTGSFAADSAETYGFEAAGGFGPFSAQAEYIFADVDSSATGDPFLSGWYAYGTYFLTGEHRPYKTSSGAFDRVVPHSNFLQGGGTGAWEIALRYSALDLDDEGVAGGELDDITVALNWYLNPNTRVMFNYVHADLDEVGTADAFQTRFQIDF